MIALLTNASGGNFGASKMIKKGKLHKSEGHWFTNEKRQGIFATHKKGVFKNEEKEVPYHKVRLTQIYKQKKSDEISMTLQKPA